MGVHDDGQADEADSVDETYLLEMLLPPSDKRRSELRLSRLQKSVLLLINYETLQSLLAKGNLPRSIGRHSVTTVPASEETFHRRLYNIQTNSRCRIQTPPTFS